MVARRCAGLFLLAVLGSAGAWAAGADEVLLIANELSPESKLIAGYYAVKRAVPTLQICWIKTSTNETVTRSEFDHEIAEPVTACLRNRRLADRVKYLVTTLGVPLRVRGTTFGLNGDYAAVDSELTLLYSDLKTRGSHNLAGIIPNPFYGKRDEEFTLAKFSMYMVTRLAAYDVEGVKAMIDRGMKATNRGKFVLDLRGLGDDAGNSWLRDAAILLPKDRVIMDEKEEPLWNAKDVIGYASWGSNDPLHNRRYPGFTWLPGAIMTEFVSTNGRSFTKPPKTWSVSRDWINPSGWFLGSPQSMIADYLLEGATGAAGHTDEPYLNFTPRPEILLPAYFSGRNLAESYYLSIPALSWQNIVVGDPLCTLGPPPKPGR